MSDTTDDVTDGLFDALQEATNKGVRWSFKGLSITEYGEDGQVAATEHLGWRCSCGCASEEAHQAAQNGPAHE